MPLDASAAVTVGGIYKITAEHVVEAVPVAQATGGDEGMAARVVAVPVQQPTGGNDISSGNMTETEASARPVGRDTGGDTTESDSD